MVHRTSIKLLSVQKARGAVLVLSREFCSLCIDPVHREPVQLGVKVAIEQQGVTMCVSEVHRWRLSFILGGWRPRSQAGKCSRAVGIAYRGLQRSNVHRGRGQRGMGLG